MERLKYISLSQKFDESLLAFLSVLLYLRKQFMKIILMKISCVLAKKKAVRLFVDPITVSRKIPKLAERGGRQRA